jgi:hypothetical protein
VRSEDLDQPLVWEASHIFTARQMRYSACRPAPPVSL